MKITDPADWAALKEDFNSTKSNALGAELDRYRRLQVSRDLSENDDHLNYTIFGDDQGRESYLSAAMRAGMALGFSPNEAVDRWLERVIREATEQGWREGSRKWWCPVPQRRGDIASESTGVLDFLSKASATTCKRLARQAMVTAMTRAKFESLRRDRDNYPCALAR